MNIDSRTAVLVVRRLVRLRDNPPLFHEGITPSRVGSRLKRVTSWLGVSRCQVVADYLRRGNLPEGGKRDWARRW